MSDEASGPAAPHGPLILTALLDPDSQARVERERRQHFPSARNLIPAHVTLFHHLPGDQLAAVRRELEVCCAGQGPAAFTATGLRFLGHGTAYALTMPEVALLRERLAAVWRPWLTVQDRQPWHAHVTIQNKVGGAEAKRLHAALQAGFVPMDGTVTGLILWEYLGGPWQCLGHHLFVEAA